MAGSQVLLTCPRNGTLAFSSSAVRPGSSTRTVSKGKVFLPSTISWEISFTFSGVKISLTASPFKFPSMAVSRIARSLIKPLLSKDLNWL
jgi:hypothetical protein